MIYFDTSSLAKAYLAENGSDEVRALLSTADSDVLLSTLSLVEFRCLLARRTRERSLSDADALRVWSTFESDIAEELLVIEAIHHEDHIQARHLIDRVAPLALKALDALHLAVVERLSNIHKLTFVTSDAQQSAAAKALTINTVSIATRTA